MNTIPLPLLLVCVLLLPAGCREEAATSDGAAQAKSGAAHLSDVTTGPEISSLEQQALQEAREYLDQGGDPDARDSLGTTRLAGAAQNDYAAVVSYLVAHGADVNAVDDQLGQTALHFCAMSDSARAAEALIQKGAKVDATDRRGKTPLHEAAAAGAVEVMKLLLSHKADVKARDTAGKTPMDRAARAHQEQAASLLLAAGSEPARPPPDRPAGGTTVVTNSGPPPTMPDPSLPSGSTTAPEQSPEIAAAGDLAEMVLWWETQPWVRALRNFMPRGVRVLMHAEPYDAEGWSNVELREEHSPESGFDPDVSPMVGIFRVSRAGKKVEWMEPVSGEYQSVEAFIKHRMLDVAGKTEPGTPVTGAAAPAPLVTAGDFECEAPAIPNQRAPVIVNDPVDPKNHVAAIAGPQTTGFTLPISVALGTEELTVSLRLLFPDSTKLTRKDDGRLSEGIRVHVRLLNALENSAAGEAIVRPTGQWREMEFTLYDLPKSVTQLGIEIVGMQGPVFVDDVRVAKP